MDVENGNENSFDTNNDSKPKGQPLQPPKKCHWKLGTQALLDFLNSTFPTNQPILSAVKSPGFFRGFIPVPWSPSFCHANPWVQPGCDLPRTHVGGQQDLVSGSDHHHHMQLHARSGSHGIPGFIAAFYCMV